MHQKRGVKTRIPVMGHQWLWWKLFHWSCFISSWSE